jgi:hypothetical protein
LFNKVNERTYTHTHTHTHIFRDYKITNKKEPLNLKETFFFSFPFVPYIVPFLLPYPLPTPINLEEHSTSPILEIPSEVA